MEVIYSRKSSNMAQLHKILMISPKPCTAGLPNAVTSFLPNRDQHPCHSNTLYLMYVVCMVLGAELMAFALSCIHSPFYFEAESY